MLLRMVKQVHHDARGLQRLFPQEVQLRPDHGHTDSFGGRRGDRRGRLQLARLRGHDVVARQRVVELGAIENLIAGEGLLKDTCQGLLLGTRGHAVADATPCHELVEVQHEDLPPRVRQHLVDDIVANLDVPLLAGVHVQDAHMELMWERALVQAQDQVEFAPKVATLHKNIQRRRCRLRDKAHFVQGARFRLVNRKLVGVSQPADTDNACRMAEALRHAMDRLEAPHVQIFVEAPWRIVPADRRPLQPCLAAGATPGRGVGVRGVLARDIHHVGANTGQREAAPNFAATLRATVAVWRVRPRDMRRRRLAAGLMHLRKRIGDLVRAQLLLPQIQPELPIAVLVEMQVPRYVAEQFLLPRRLSQPLVPQEIVEHAVVDPQRVGPVLGLLRRQSPGVGQQRSRQARGSERRGAGGGRDDDVAVQCRGHGRVVNANFEKVALADGLRPGEPALRHEKAVPRTLLDNDVLLAVVTAIEAADGPRLHIRGGGLHL
mmetsp:Transcript_5843/g.16503  ORF Transcript_5843/g.16503 Transcript_5843/m.16503 type:complete len:491 (-) Transcript_5843:922-2394(-)